MNDSLFDGLFEEFSLEAREQLDRIEARALDLEVASAAQREGYLVEIRRDLHTIKGNAGMMGLADLQQYAHHLEDNAADEADARILLEGVDAMRAVLDALHQQRDANVSDSEHFRPAASDEGGVRVPFAVLDTLFDRISEMVIFRNRLRDAIGRAAQQSESGHHERWREVEAAHRALSSTLDFLQNGITSLRMVPLGNLFASWRRLVHDEALDHGKQVDLRGLGADTPIDKTLLEVASEAVGHLVRNAVVHGIETPQLRAQAGKDPLGRVVVAASTRGDEVLVDVEDDGAGIDVAALERRAHSLGLEIPADLHRHALVFLPGLSTASSTNRSAGRGMGMAAVAESVRRRGGQVEVYSELGVGTRFRLRLPLTASIVRALLLEADGRKYVVPMAMVHETLAHHAGDRRTLVGSGFLTWRDEYLPLLDLGMAFGTCLVPREAGRIVVVEAGNRRRALVVDRVLSLLDVVVRGLDEVLDQPQGVAGCTILGDGQVAIIVDPAALDRDRLVEARLIEAE